MRATHLILLKWRGDVIAAHTVKRERAGYDRIPTDPSFEAARAGAAPADDVSVEVHEVPLDRRDLGLEAHLDGRAILGVLTSIGFHGVLALALLVGVLASKEGGAASPDDQANEQAAQIRDLMARIEQDENALEKEQQRNIEAAEKGAAEPEVLPEVPLPNHNQDSPPEPDRKDDALAAGEPEAPQETVAEAEPAPEPPKEPGQRGTDTSATSKAVCNLAPPPKNSGPTCKRDVVVTSLSSEPFCFVDTIVQQGQQGTLTFPCDGDGAATLSFGGRAFVGAAIGGKVEACTGTQYPFNDGCTWTSAQRVTGSIANGTLHFAYGEAPKAGEDTRSCARACTARGTVRILTSI